MSERDAGYVSAATVAKALGYTTRSVTGWCRAGVIPGARQPAGYLGKWEIPRAWYQTRISETDRRT